MKRKQQRMPVDREILAHDKILPAAVYDKHSTTHGLQKGNISAR